MNQVFLALVTGLTAGGVSCLAVQGGLLASTLSSAPENKKTFATFTFLWAKVLAYTVLGALLGYFGSSLSITPSFQGFLQIAAGIYMLATAANILNLHPIFRYAVITPPKWAFRLLKSESQKRAAGPAILGAMTVLIPCGITQGFMLSAIASGNTVLGALTLGAFTLGSSPLFFVIGASSGVIFEKKSLAYLASVIIGILGIMSINSGQVLRGSPHNINNYLLVLGESDQRGTAKAATIDESGKQVVNISVSSSGYKQDVSVLKSGTPVSLNLKSNGASGCARAFTIPSMGITKLLPENGEVTIEFTPKEKGRLAFSCSMGMYGGSFSVI